MKSFFVPLRGWHVLAMLLVFFGVVFAVNFTFIAVATRTHPGEEVSRAYARGLDFNDTLERRHRQASLGWNARFNLVEGVLLVEVRDPAGEPVRGLDLAGAMTHPTTTARDCPLEFLDRGDGVYAAVLPCREAGQWRVRAENRSDAPFEMEHDLWLP